MAKSTAQPRTVKPVRPVHGTVRLHKAPGYHLAGVNEVVTCGRVEINGQHYVIKPIAVLVDDAPAVVGYRLVKTTGPIVYDVSVEDGYSCSCPDFIFRREGKDHRGCKHILSIRSLRGRGKLK